MDDAKPKPIPISKVQIQYPPLTLRKWKPPARYLNHDPKKKIIFKRKPIFPKHHHLKHSKLGKIWHRYKALTKTSFILRGHFNQQSLRFSRKNRGRQQTGSCIACMGLLQCCPPDKWNEYTIDTIMYMGDRIYGYSCYINKKKCIDCIYEMYTNIYVSNLYMILNVEDAILGKFFKEVENDIDLDGGLRDFFMKYTFGIIEVEHRQMFMFKWGSSYYLFDPNGRDETGRRPSECERNEHFICSHPIPPCLRASVLKFFKIRSLICNIQVNVDEETNHRYILYPITIKRREQRNFSPPNSVEEFRSRLKPTEDPQSKCEASKVIPVPPPPPKYPEGLPPERQPIQSPPEPSQTFFHEIQPKKFGILHASFHQNDKNCSRNAGKNTFSNAVASIAMRRQYKSRNWVKLTLDSILFTAEAIYLDSLKNLAKNQELGIKELTDRIKIGEKVYTAKIENTTIFGTLGSMKSDVLDLKAALEELFADHDAGIIRGPAVIAVWSEQGRYYMWDPNERNKEGRIIEPPKPPPTADKKDKSGTNIGDKKKEKKEEGFACLTWHSTVESLVDLYTINLPSAMRMEPFKISAVEIKDYVELPNPWHNFNSVEYGRWILRGLKSDSTNEQGTAISIMALAFSQIKPVNTWERNTVDEILNAGGELYGKSYQDGNPKLFVSEVLTRFQIDGNKDIVTHYIECYIYGCVDVPDNHEYLNLKRGLEKFFEKDKLCVITAKGLSMAVWLDNDFYYLFDSHTRDENGYTAYIGTACVVRFQNLTDLVSLILANLQADTITLYNIARIDISSWENEDGTSRPPLNNFTTLSNQIAILRASSHQGDKELFDIYADQQTIPNILVALAMPMILPTVRWKQETVDEILDFGEKYYEETLAARVKKMKHPKSDSATTITKDSRIVDPEPEVENAEAEVPNDKAKSAEAVNKPPVPIQQSASELTIFKNRNEIWLDECNEEFKLGINKFVFSVDEVTTGQMEYDEKLHRFSPKPWKNESNMDTDAEENEMILLDKTLKDFFEEEGDSVKMAVLETSKFTVGIWREDGVFYLFDPCGKDSEGKPLGRALWTPIQYPEEPMGEEELHMRKLRQALMQEEASLIPEGPQHSPSINDPNTHPLSHVLPGIKFEEMGEEEGIPSFTISTISLDIANAKACVIQFVTLDELYHHIIESTPPLYKEKQFILHPINLKNIPDIKIRAFPLERSLGDWNNFQEIDKNQWILRGTLEMGNEMYPICNRGNQYVAMCVVALGFAELYDIDKFDKITVNEILKYGDRLHTLLMKNRTECAKKSNPEMGQVELCVVLNQIKVKTEDLMKNFLLHDYRLDVEVVKGVVVGDIMVVDEMGLNSIHSGLKEFFEKFEMGVFTCKDKSWGIWKEDKFYYMFDPESCGPNGVVEENGFACITRHRKLSKMAGILRRNQGKSGLNDYYIDRVVLKVEYANRPEPDVEKIISINPKITAFEEITPGKLILSGNFNQNNPKFEKMINALTCPIAFVALAMSLIHKSETWTKPIVDEVLINGNTLYDVTKENLGNSFNPWEDSMTVELVNKVFRIGVWEATIILCDNTEEGILNIIHSSILNLRKAVEKFFQKNTHGIIEVDCQTCSIWTENNLFYLFDPYPRGSTGLYQIGGTACLMVFKDTKLLNEHFLQNTPCGDCQFKIIPVKIRVCEQKQPKKKPLQKCQILQCKDIKIFDASDSDTSLPKQPFNPPPCEPNTDQNLQKCLKLQEKKQWAQKMSQKRQKALQDKQNKKMKYEFTIISPGVAILRGNYSQNDHRYSQASRNKQSIPNALVAIVMSKLHDPSTWTYKNIDIILDSGDALYKDSWWYYKPYNPNLGLKNVLRTFHIEHCKVTTHVYKSAIMGDLVFRALYVGLLNFFLHETSGIVYTKVYNIAVFQKSGSYYMFDPYDRDRDGNPVRCGVACCLKFDNVESMAKKLIDTAGSFACSCECGRRLQFGDECETRKPGDDDDDVRYCIHAVTLENLTPVTPKVSIQESIRSCTSDDYV